MDFYDIALELELEGEKVLRRLADNTTSIALRKIFLLLADDEKGHQMILEKLREGNIVEIDSKGINEASNIFLNAVGNREETDRMVRNVDLYKELRVMEDKAEDLYYDQAEKVKDKKLKEIFYKLAEEEQRHGVLLDNLLELIEEKVV